MVSVERSERLVERKILEYRPRELAAPALDRDTGDLMVGTRDGWVRLFDRRGRPIWYRELGVAPIGMPLLTFDGAFVALADGRLVALDRFSGQVLWEQQLRAQVLNQPVEQDGVLFVGTDHDSVHALDAETGDPLWVYRRSTPSRLTIRGGSGVSVEDGRVFAGFSDGTLVALDVDEGRLLWQTGIAPGSVERFPDVDASPVVAQGMVFATIFNDGVLAFEQESGKVRWRADARGAHSLTVEGDKLLVGGAERVRAFDLRTGGLEWSTSIGKTWVTRPVVAQKVAFFAGPEGLHMVDLSTGKPLSLFQPGSGFDTPPVTDGERLWLLSNLGTLFTLRVVADGGA